jgi:Glucodextranase, domain B
MRGGWVRVVAGVAMLAVSAMVSVGAPSAAAPGTGTFTQITTPAKDLRYTFKFGSANSFPVAGTASFDVSSVDIFCVVFLFGESPDTTLMATGVPVTAGEFSTTATFPSSSPPSNCRLRAIPSGVNVDNDYLGSYTGPILYTNGLQVAKNGPVPYGYTGYVEEGDGLAVLTDAGSCGTEVVITVDAPQMLAGPVVLACAFSLPPANIDPTGSSTRSTVRVDGRNAYLPSGVESYLINTRGLALAQPPLSVSRHVAKNGDTTVTERATLMRCSQSNAYPPTSSSCPSLVSTGVRFTRVSLVFRNGHQTKIRDSFTSTDHQAHSLALQYVGEAVNQTDGGATGNVGYTYPHHSSAFHAASLGQQVTGLGSKAGTMVVRSDLRARTDDPTADTLAETWSHAPSKITYSTATHDQYGMQTSVKVPKSGTASLGFALSERWRTAQVKKLASSAITDMMSAPRITSPANGATVKGKTTTVKGTLRAGANGLPVSVKVNGHRARITRHGSTSATYKVRFHEPLGRHTITVKATDLAGNTRSASIRIRNT